MEQFFVILAIIVFWLFRGAVGSARRRIPGQDAYEDGRPGPGGPIDVVGSTRQRTVEGQQRAIEALRRWEEKQGLTGGEQVPVRSAGSRDVPAASRTRAGRPARIAARTTAERRRRQAYADIARMLDSRQIPGAVPRGRRQFGVEEPSEAEAVARAPRASRPAAEAPPRAAEEVPARTASGSAGKPESPGARRTTAKPAGPLAKIDRLPLAARAILYSEVLGPPRSLS